MPLGIFGGTFDPVHFGHLRLAEEAADALQLGAVRWIPAGMPALRGTPQVSAEHRLAMVRLAIESNPRFELDGSEVLSSAPSYTVPTLERLRREAVGGDGQPLVLLVGADAFAKMENWHRWERLLDLSHIGVAHRPGYSIDPTTLSPALAALFRARSSCNPEDLKTAPAGNIVTFAMTPLDISATRIRTLLSNGQSPRYLLPDVLMNYIRQHQFYLGN